MEAFRASGGPCSIGEAVEWFDFMVYLSLAPVLARVFFAADSRSSLLVTLGIFAAAFLARPIGAVFFGQLGDRVGRKRALVVSALLMAVAKLIEGLLPTFAMVGFFAPAVFLLARTISGFSLGGEFTGTFVMLFESARAGRRGLTTSLANVMAGMGVLLASGLVAVLTASLSKVFFRHEVPILAGCRAVGPLCAVGFAEKFHSDFQVRQPARRWLLRMRRTLHK